MQYPDIFFKRRGWLCQSFMVFIMCFLFLGGNATAADTAPTQSMATCLYDVVEDLLPEYFSPKAKTELWDLNDGSIAFGRSYPSNPYQSGLMIVGNDVYYSLFGKWTYYNTFDFSENNFAGGKCRSQVEAYACSTPLVSNPASSTSLGSKTIEPQGVVQKSKLWPNGSTLNVAFDFQGQDLRGSATCSTTQSVSACETMIKAEVIKAASIWSQYGNIKFNFDTPWNNGDIRIRFRFEGGGYSLVGIDARSTSKSQETMMLGVSIGLTGTTIHEFGHAIGFHHEHQNPSVAYHWNKNEVYSYMERTQNPPWSHEQTDSNILNPLDKTGITKTDLFNTNYDPKSIMVYFIPSQWVSAADKANPAVCPSTKAQWCVEDNTGTLSELDKWTVAQVYPFQVSCNYTVSPSTFSIVASGKSGLSSTVNTQNTCSWTASSNTSWITLSNTSGQGNGQISYNVAPNTSTSSRTGVINVSGQSITITQAGVTAVACSYTVSPTQASNIAATGQSGLSAMVTTQSNCAWTASSNVSWITLSTASGKGNGQVSYNVAANSTTSTRTGTITAGDKTIVINQAGTTAVSTPKAVLSNNTYIDSCKWGIYMDLTGFTPNSQVTVSSEYTEVTCPKGEQITSSWSNIDGTTTANGTLTVAYLHQGTGNFRYTFTDKAGKSATLSFSTSR